MKTLELSQRFAAIPRLGGLLCILNILDPVCHKLPPPHPANGRARFRHRDGGQLHDA